PADRDTLLARRHRTEGSVQGRAAVSRGSARGDRGDGVNNTMTMRAFFLFCFCTAAAFAATEELIDSRYRPIAPDAAMGDWQGAGYIAQVSVVDAGKYEANIFKAFDEPNAKPVAVLHGSLATLEGDGWQGAIAGGHFKAAKGNEQFDLQHVTR